MLCYENNIQRYKIRKHMHIHTYSILLVCSKEFHNRSNQFYYFERIIISVKVQSVLLKKNDENEIKAQ